MTEAPIRQPLKVQFGFAYAYGLLAVALAGAAFIGGAYGVRPTRVVNVPRIVAPATAAALVAAWGKPDQQVDGAQVSQGLSGTTCAVYRSRKAVLCYAP